LKEILEKEQHLKQVLNEASNDLVVIKDTDLKYDPNDYYKLVKPIVKGEDEVVYDSRFIGSPHRALYYWHYVGNTILTTFSNILTNLNLYMSGHIIKFSKKKL